MPVFWGASAFLVTDTETGRLPSRWGPEPYRVTNAERAILALGAGLVTAGVLMRRSNRE